MTKKLTVRASRDDQCFVLENRFDVAIPVCLVELGGAIYAECYPIVKKAVRAHIARFEQTLFSRASLAALQSSVLPLLAPYGYDDDCHRNRVYRIYRANADTAAQESNGNGVRILLYGEETRSPCHLTLNLADGYGRGCLAVCIEEDGEIVSAVQTHEDPTGSGEYAEVTVETLPRARGKGYATRALLEMRRRLAMLGIGMEYRVSERNRASIACAEKAGLSYVGNAYYYVLRYRKEKDTNGL